MYYPKYIFYITYTSILSRFLAFVCISGMESDFSSGALLVKSSLRNLLSGVSANFVGLEFGKSKKSFLLLKFITL